MQAYIIRRLLLMIPTVLLVSMICFFTVRFIPGDVIDLMSSQMSSEFGVSIQTEEHLRHALGLDVPAHVQYWNWLVNALHGDLGKSLWRTSTVTHEIFGRMPISLELGILGILLGISIAVPIGVYSAIRQDTSGDYIGRTIAILFISVPVFWLGTIVVVYPAIWWNWSPTLAYTPFFEDPIRNLGQFIVPAIILGMYMSGVTMRMTRTMMLEVLRQDYIRTAWSKGLAERTVVIRHALKNALIPVITIIGIQVPVIIGGFVVLEQIFSLPGIGRLMLDALNTRDYPVISGINLILAIVILVINLLVDLTYAFLDPRVRYA